LLSKGGIETAGFTEARFLNVALGAKVSEVVVSASTLIRHYYRFFDRTPREKKPKLSSANNEEVLTLLWL